MFLKLNAREESDAFDSNIYDKGNLHRRISRTMGKDYVLCYRNGLEERKGSSASLLRVCAGTFVAGDIVHVKMNIAVREQGYATCRLCACDG